MTKPTKKAAAKKTAPKKEAVEVTFDNAPVGGIVTDEGGRPVTDEGGRPLRKDGKNEEA